MGKQLIFRPGLETPQETKINKPPTLDEMHKIVGGYIELVAQWETDRVPYQVVVNEEGLFTSTPNVAGTLWFEQNSPVSINMGGGMLHGNVLVLVGIDAIFD